MKTLTFLATILLVLFLVPVLSAQTAQRGAPAASSRGAGTHSPASATSTSATAATAPAPAAAGSTTATRISVGDLLEVSIYGLPELLQHARVSTTGKIYLPLVGYVSVAGLSIEEAQTLLEQTYLKEGYLKDPHVTVSLVESAAGALVNGEVAKPGIYPVFGSRQLLDLLAAAGGVTPTAGTVVTIIHAAHPNEPERVLLSEDPMQNMKANVAVYQGDIVAVSKAGVVYVFGDVVNPGTVVIERQQTSIPITKAIALAHGPQKTAALDRTHIIRKTAGDQQEIQVPLGKILRSKSADFSLLPGDIVYVPSSTAKSALRRGVEAGIAIGTAAAIYGAVR
jgi:polysaccharide export outer membrane protein